MPKATLESPTVRAVANRLALRARANRPALRMALFEDHEQIAALQAANGLSTKPVEEWVRLWRDNPAYQDSRDWPIGWVLEDDERRIVGVLENIPCHYRFRGATHVAAFGRGWAVDAAYRGYSLLLLLMQRRQAGVDLLMTSTASPDTARILTDQRWLRVPSGAWDRSAFWVANYSQAVQRYLAAKAPGVISSVGGRLLSAPLLLTDILARFPRRSKTRFQLCWLPCFDDRFDRFWAELESRNPGVLLSVRNRQTLDWHFRHGLDQNRVWILAASEGRNVAAYAVFERRDSLSLNVNRTLFVDFQVLEPAPELTSAMLSAALERCRLEGVHVLENVGCWLETKHSAQNAAPYHRGLGHWCFLYHARNGELAPALEKPASWYPTQFDTDASL